MTTRQKRRLILKYLRETNRAKELWKKSDAALELLSANAGETVTLSDGRQFRIVDQFEASGVSGKFTMFHRFKLEEVKQPKGPKKAAVDEEALP